MKDNMCECCRCGRKEYVWHTQEIECKNGKHTFCSRCISGVKKQVDPIKKLQAQVDCLEWLLINNYVDEQYTKEYYDTLEDKITHLAFDNYEV